MDVLLLNTSISTPIFSLCIATFRSCHYVFFVTLAESNFHLDCANCSRWLQLTVTLVNSYIQLIFYFNMIVPVRNVTEHS